MKPLSQMTDGDLTRNFRKMWRWIGENWQKGEDIYQVKERYFERLPEKEIPQDKCYLCGHKGCCLVMWADDETCEYAEYGVLKDAGTSMSLKQRKALAIEISKLPARRKRDRQD